MYDDYIGGQPSAATRTSHASQSHQVLQTPTVTTTTTDTAPTLTNSSSQAADILNSSQDVDELEPQPQHAQNTFVNPFDTPTTYSAESSSH
ncbi:hypothetical protein Tco_0081274 [Tanacetum coccineum]